MEEYALCSSDIHLKWKDSKQMLAIFANMCIGGGLWVRKDIMVSRLFGMMTNHL